MITRYNPTTERTEQEMHDDLICLAEAAVGMCQFRELIGHADICKMLKGASQYLYSAASLYKARSGGKVA